MSIEWPLSVNQALIPLAQWLGTSADQLVYGLMASLGIFVMLLLWFTHRKTVNLHKKMERLQRDLLVSNHSAIGMGQQLLSLEKQLQKARTPPYTQQSTPASTVASTAEKTVLTVVSSTPSINNASANHHAPLFTDDDNEDVIYEKSRKLLAQGYDIQEVIKQSGLSYSEVSLMKALTK
jgi:hypothetical protein